MSIKRVEFDVTGITFDKGRFGSWLKIGTIFFEEDAFYLFSISKTSPNALIIFAILNLPSTPTLAFVDSDDVNVLAYQDTTPLLINTWQFVEFSWNHTYPPSHHVYVGDDVSNAERTMSPLYSVGTVESTGIAEDLKIGYIGYPTSEFQIAMQNILVSTLDTRDLYALRNPPDIIYI